MSQYFLLSRAANSLTLAAVIRMTEAEAEKAFRSVRWAETQGEPVCPKCGGLNAYDCRRANGAPRFRCKGCAADLSITSGTLFASHKMPLRQYLAAIVIFINEVKGREGLVTADLFGFLTTTPNAVVGPIHPKAMPVILTSPEEIETWLTAPVKEALALQRPLADDALRIVARGRKQDGA